MRFFKLLLMHTQVLVLLCQKDEQKTLLKIETAKEIARHVYLSYILLYDNCLSTSMTNQRFFVDNLHSYINALSKTTVGYAPVFTSKRKFFANMINTAAFKNMLAKDVTALQNNYVEKMKFCDISIMDQENLKQFYDREVDQTKL